MEKHMVLGKNCILHYRPEEKTIRPDERRFIDMELDGLFELTGIEILFRLGGYYHYGIYASGDGRNFYKIAYKNDDIPASLKGDVHDLTKQEQAKKVCRVRVNVSCYSASYEGKLKEIRLYGKRVGEAPILPEDDLSVADFGDSAWGAEYEKCCRNPVYAKEKVLAELSRMTGRVLGEKWRNSFLFRMENVGMNKERDAFSVESMKAECEEKKEDGNRNRVKNRICISGRNGISLASGFHYYLKHFAHVNYNPLFVSQLEMPEELPPVPEKVVRETPYRVRYALNFCTYSYTMAFWGWKEYEAFLDWCAMNGVTLLLDLVGQEEVQRRLLMKYGYTDEEVREYLTGPAYFAWFYMQNMSSYGGPLPDNWFRERVELGRRLHDRMQTFGIQPVLQGFAGMVPSDFGVKHPDAEVMEQGLWCGFRRPDMLRTCGLAPGKRDYFTELAEDFYEIQKAVFGEITDYFAVDPFHEGGLIGDLKLSEAYRRIQTKMLESNPLAVWILQQWQGQITEEKIGHLAVPKQVLILDLQAELRSYSALMEQKEIPWVWCMLHNFGGRMGMTGDLETLSQEIPMCYKNSRYMAGIGITPEAFGHTSIAYEMLFDMAWTEKPADSAAYVRTYAQSRYGRIDETMIHAWETLLRTVYGKKRTYTQGAMESVIYARPCESFTAASTWGHSRYEYDKRALEPVLLDFLAVYEEYQNIPAFRFDMVDVAKQVLATSAIEIHKFMIQAYREKDLKAFQKWSGEFLEMIFLMNQVLGCCPEYGVGKWLKQARMMYGGMDDWTKDLFEFNARALITTWAGRSANRNGLQDYSNRQWSGVTRDYALVRWENFVERYWRALEEEKTPEPFDYFLKEWEWVNRKSDEAGDGYQSTGAHGDLKALAQEVYERFSLTKLGVFTEREDENIAVHKPVSSTLGTAPGSSLESLTDNDITTVWKADRAGEVTLTVDLEGFYKISRIKFAMPPVAGDYAWNYEVRVYDGTRWNEIPAEQRETLLGTVEITCATTGNRVQYRFRPKHHTSTVPTAEFAELFVCGRE